MKNILVPCDFSKPSINAFKIALDVAVRSKGAVHLVHVIEFPSVPNTRLTPVRVMGNAMMKEMNEEGARHFEKIIAAHRRKGVKIHSSVAFGVPVATLLNYVKEHAIDLIVIGSHGAKIVTDWFVGSTTEKIIRTSSVPVIAVQEYVTKPIRAIVLPFTPELLRQRYFIEKVQALQRFFRARLEVVHVNTLFNFTADYITEVEMKDFAAKYKLKNVNLSITNDNDAETGILRFAEVNKADMIAMGTHGRKGLAHLLNGSHTENVAMQGKKLIWTSLLDVTK